MPVKRFMKRILRQFDYELVSLRTHYYADGMLTCHNPRFLRSPEFLDAYARGVTASAGVDPKFHWRAHVALWAARKAVSIEGDFVEAGVNAGFLSSAILHDLDWGSLKKTFYLIDTFSGPVLDQYSPEEILYGRREIAREAIERQAYRTDLDQIRTNFAEWPNAVIVPGAVPDVLPTIGAQRVAFLHIDMNCAYPEAETLRYFWHRLTPGGVVLFDDYVYVGNPAQGDAIDAAARVLGAEVLALPTGQGLLIR